MKVIVAKSWSRCPRCQQPILPGRKIIRAFDLRRFVHVRCMNPQLPAADVDVDGLASGFTVGFTGSRQFGPQAERLAGQWLTAQRADAFVTGGCRGADAVVGRFLYKRFPEAKHVVVVPANRAAVKNWWSPFPAVEVFEMPEGSTYKERNEVIVELADHLVAFVAAPEGHPSSSRSGTWQTVRIARDQRVPITYMDLTAPTQWSHTPRPQPAPKPEFEATVEELF